MIGLWHGPAVALLFASLVFSAPARAQGVTFPGLSASVPDDGDTTYLDLARMVVPDLAAKDDGSYAGSAPIEMRHIEGGDSGGPPPDSTTVFDAAVLPVKAAGKDRLAMLLDFGSGEDSAEGFAALALYDLSGTPKLLDVVNVATDKDSYFRDPGKFAIGAADDALMTMSMHFNSNQSYVTTQLILVRNDRFEPVDSIFTFDEQACGYRSSQNLAFRAGPGELSYADIIATVIDATEATGEDCGDTRPPPVASRTITVTYHWDGARYIPDSDSFGKLAEEDAKRF
jgi:hypothetical protein